jgi:hypothetical protein
MEQDLGKAAQAGVVELPCIRCDDGPHHAPAASHAAAAAPLSA